MATQICPKCKKNSFTWDIDDESSLTRWGCRNCFYTAYEDETFERICSGCKNKTEKKLQDEESKYWWCNICNTVLEIKN